nr:MAG TPA: hypothetical protein [Crassvirales sp.]
MTLAQIKALFKTGAIPTQSDFESLIDKIPNNEGGGDIDLSNPATPYLNGIRTVIDGSESCTYIAIIAIKDIDAEQFTIPVAFRSYTTGIGDEAFLFQASYGDQTEQFVLSDINDSNILKGILEGRDWVSIPLKEQKVLEPYIVNLNNEKYYVINRVNQNNYIRCTTIQLLHSSESSLYYVKAWDILTQGDWVKLKNAIENNTISSNITPLTNFINLRCKQV